ncbi:hypothetical protein AMECASPLE_031253 [Ameca splendens]|uniref:Uncharacterized protein n=1 Tax=Ameca splendens TaxID=208324 RepID=A0ABV0YTI2_9TELE
MTAPLASVIEITYVIHGHFQLALIIRKMGGSARHSPTRLRHRLTVTASHDNPPPHTPDLLLINRCSGCVLCLVVHEKRSI